MNNEEVNIEKLKEALDHICIEEVHLKSFEEISLEDFLRLKTTLSNVNNLITKKLSIKCIDALYKLGIISENEKEHAQKSLSNVNSPGYDIIIEGQQYKVIAEVKANVPYKIDNYGAKQKEEINKDLYCLMNGKTKSKDIRPQEYIKFFVQLDVKGKKNNIDYDSEHAMKSITENMPNIIYDFDSQTEFSTDKIYVLLLEA